MLIGESKSTTVYIQVHADWTIYFEQTLGYQIREEI
jgi:hypothetical protein